MSESQGRMPVRDNARVVLINDKNEILLMHVQLPSHSFWCTIGGGMQNGEIPEIAVKREAQEEIGFGYTDIRWEKPIWYGEHVMERKGVPTLHKETFVLGWTNRNKINSDGMTEEEQEVVQQFKWWSLEELQTTSEFIVPPSLVKHLKSILQGEIPQEIMTIDLTNTPPPKLGGSDPAP